MKKAILILLAALLPVGVVSAQTPPATPAGGSSAAQRLEQRKQERQIVLEEKDQRRLTQVCVASQGKISQIQRATAPAFAERLKLYDRIDANLWVVIGQLKLGERDTFELEKQRALLAEKTANFQVTLNNYTQTLDDIAVINCQADVVGFKALVETARLYHVQLREQSGDIRTYIVDTIKTSLDGFIAELRQANEGN